MRDTPMNQSEILEWSKELSTTDAQQETLGSQMRFLRLTQGSLSETDDFRTWFRETFFAGLTWEWDQTQQTDPEQRAEVQFGVLVPERDLGLHTMIVSYRPERAEQHSAPPIHLK